MSRAIIHVSIDEDLLDRIEALVDTGKLTKSEIVRRTLGYGIGEMEQAINRLTNGDFIPRGPVIRNT
jgi:metal-responsive CopG/Arc/MetJ family transcriptional regulator